MNDSKLFVFLVVVGFSFAMLLSFVPWDLYGACFQKGMAPDITNTEQKCIELSTPGVFGISESILNHNIKSSLKQFTTGIPPLETQCRSSLFLVIKYDNSPACVYSKSVQKLIDRGWAKNNPIPHYSIGHSQITEGNVQETQLQVEVTGLQQVRSGTTHTIFVDVSRNDIPVSDAFVRLTIEDFGDDIIREFEGRTNQSGEFVFSWEIPQRFDDIETLFAYVNVSDANSSKTVLFKFQVYCLPGEPGCKIEGN